MGLTMRQERYVPEAQRGSEDKERIPMPTATITSSRRMIRCTEQADCLQLSHQIDAVRGILSGEDAFVVTVAGATVAVAPERFGAKLSVVAGLGTNGPVTEADLCAIESIYSGAGLSAAIDLCPYADQGTIEALASRGYRIIAFLNIFVLSLDGVQTDQSPFGTAAPAPQAGYESAVEISYVDPDKYELFVRRSAEGFKDNGRSAEVLEILAQAATLRSDTTLYSAEINGEVVGTGALAIIETHHGRVAYLYHGSTISRYRGRGVHRALDCARVLDARKKGCDIAMVATRMGSASGRNAERLGFRVAYTKAYFSQGGCDKLRPQ